MVDHYICTNIALVSHQPHRENNDNVFVSFLTIFQFNCLTSLDDFCMNELIAPMGSTKNANPEFWTILNVYNS